MRPLTSPGCTIGPASTGRATHAGSDPAVGKGTSNADGFPKKMPGGQRPGDGAERAGL
jgi:hypothetical protein